MSDSEATKKMIILLSDGYPDPDIKVSNEILQKANNGQIKIHTICLGNDCDEAEMQRIANTTGGTCFKATSNELPEIYEEISIGADFNRQDTDGDKFPDEVETKGIRTKTGQTIQTAPLTIHSDTDWIEDGVEINPILVKFTYKGYYKDQVFTSVSYGYKMISNLTKYNSDGDGIDNVNNTEPLYEGLKGGIIGEPTIISSKYTAAGHAYLVYKSYIKVLLSEFSTFRPLC